MQRNLDRRVELLVPIVDPAIEARIVEILTLDWSDDVQTWQLDAEGHWERLERREGRCAQAQLSELAIERSRTMMGRA